jgi:lauroyl/myristoyl acyltransferase
LNVIQRHAYDFGAGFGKLLWPFFRKRAKTAVDNILACGITADPAVASRIARQSFGHLAGHICEALCVPGVVDASNWRAHLDVTSEAADETVKLLLDSPETPIILASAHHGVWEAATNTLSFARPMIAVARVMNNRVVARWMKKHHFRGPVTVIDKTKGFTPEVLRQWRRERAAMTILMDQHTRGGLLLSFLGRPARTFTTAARLARLRATTPFASRRLKNASSSPARSRHRSRSCSGLTSSISSAASASTASMPRMTPAMSSAQSIVRSAGGLGKSALYAAISHSRSTDAIIDSSSASVATRTSAGSSSEPAIATFGGTTPPHPRRQASSASAKRRFRPLCAVGTTTRTCESECAPSTILARPSKTPFPQSQETTSFTKGDLGSRYALVMSIIAAVPWPTLYHRYSPTA